MRKVEPLASVVVWRLGAAAGARGGGCGGAAGAVRVHQSGGSEAGGAPVGSGGSSAASTRQVRRSRAQALGVGR